MSTPRLLVPVVISSLMFAACSKKGASPESETAPTPMATEATTTVVAEPVPEAMEAPPPVEEPPAPAAPPLNDAQIAKILEAVDSGEIEQAKIAQKKSKNPKVKKYAQHMIQEHTKSKQKGTKLTKKAKITPEDSPVAAELTGKATQQLESLKAADAASIDALYISAQAQQHDEVLELVNAQLLPAAGHEELKTLLGEVRTMVETHAASAKEIQQSLTANAAGGAATGTPATGGADAGSIGASP